MSAILAASRSSLRAAQAPALRMARRSLHVENTPENVRAHAPLANLSRVCAAGYVSDTVPFKVGPKNKGTTAVGVFTFFTLGLSLPLVAVGFQQYVGASVPLTQVEGLVVNSSLLCLAHQ